MTNFECVTLALKKIQERNIKLNDSIVIVDKLKNKLNNARGHIAIAAKQKLEWALSNNEGFAKITEIAKITDGEISSASLIESYSLNELSNFSYAPITNCDVERSFSSYKLLYSEKEVLLLRI